MLKDDQFVVGYITGNMIGRTFVILCIVGVALAGKFDVEPKQLQPVGKMPAVGLGTWQAKDSELEQALEIALEAGYRHIDTATIYENEKVIGKVLNKWLTSGKVKREDLFIVSKLPPKGNRPEGVSKYLNKSLVDLQLDYLDLYLIHAPYSFTDADGADSVLDFSTDHIAIWKAMEEQVDKGKTKAIGISNFNIKQIQRLLDNSRIKPTNLQVELHAYYQQVALVEFCKKNNIVVTAYSPLGSPGLGKYLSQTGQNVTIPNILSNPVIQEVAKKHSKSEAQVVLRHALQKGLVVIPKSTNAKRLKENLDVFSFELDSDDMQKLNGLDKGDKGKLIGSPPFPGIEKHPEYNY